LAASKICWLALINEELTFHTFVKRWQLNVGEGAKSEERSFDQLRVLQPISAVTKYGIP
jgi:hypothetical protein